MIAIILSIAADLYGSLFEYVVRRTGTLNSNQLWNLGHRGYTYAQPVYLASTSACSQPCKLQPGALQASTILQAYCTGDSGRDPQG